MIPARLAPPEPPTLRSRVAVTLYCPRCGLERREGERFCRNCGQALGTGDTVLHESPVATTAPLGAPPAAPGGLPPPPAAPEPAASGSATVRGLAFMATSYSNSPIFAVPDGSTMFC